MKLPRPHYVDLLKHRMHNGLVKVITGIRRCGKSYLLSTLFGDYLRENGVSADHIIELPLDREEFREYRDPLRLGEFIRSRILQDGAWNYVFIDEIQLARRVLPPDVDLSRIAPEDREGAYISFYDILNGVRQMDHVDVYVTGSNSKTLSSDIGTNFADRGCQIHVHPFSFAEYCEALNLEDKLSALGRYLTWGGMPLAVAEPDDQVRADYLKGLFDEAYLNDIRQHNRLRDDLVLQRLVDLLASSIGSLSNPSKLASTLKSTLGIQTSTAVIQKYLEYLEDSFLFSQARRWDVKGKRYFDYPVKYYAEDLGLRNARLNFRQLEPSHAMENAIYNELIRRGCSVDVGVVPITATDSQGKRELRNHEIDFVVNRPPNKLYIQSAFSMPSQEKENQELLPLRKSGDFFAKMIITNGYLAPQLNDEGIIQTGIIPFLMDPTILDNALRMV